MRLHKPKCAQMFVVFREPSVKGCDFVHILGCLFLFATGHLALASGTPLTDGIPGIPCSLSAASTLLCPPSLCPGSVWASVSSATVLQHPTG